MKSNIIFEGDGPFHLPTELESATAHGRMDSGITMTLKAPLPGRQERYGLEAIKLQMTVDVAWELGNQLVRAAREASDIFEAS